MRLATGFALISFLALHGEYAPAQQVSSPDANARGAGVRIVRLSEVRGIVELDRNIGRGYEPGFLNLPIVQGSRLRTKDLSWAEVEFEDNSTLRMTPRTAVVFPTLARDSSGLTHSAVSLLEGTLYASRLKGDRSDLVVTAIGRTMTLGPGTHIRLDVYPAGSELVVVQGTVRVVGQTGEMVEIDHHHALKFGGNGPTQQVSSRDEAPGLYDRWDAAATEYHAARSMQGVSQYGYGTQDLQYYGGFETIGGCGRVWRPYLASAGFDPAASGTWAWYADTGYTFVSPYQWGWTTFNSGSWVSCGSQGWGWRPGAWVGLKNPGIVEPIHGPGHRPHPGTEPVGGKPTLVRAGNSGVWTSRVSYDHPTQFVKDSAGFGIPRGSVENLKQISRAFDSGRSVPPAVLASNLLEASPLATAALANQSTNKPMHPGLSTGVPLTHEIAVLQSRPTMPALSVAGGASFSRSGGYDGGRTGSGSSSFVGNPSFGGNVSMTSPAGNASASGTGVVGTSGAHIGSAGSSAGGSSSSAAHR
jgi:hypothetical protein